MNNKADEPVTSYPSTIIVNTLIKITFREEKKPCASSSWRRS
jgi:hypothetical protein